MYVCKNESCAMHRNKLDDQAASALKFQCPVCKQYLQADRQSDQSDIDVAGFPTVIALALQEYYEETNPVLKLWHACDVIELMLRLMVIVGLADIKSFRKELPEALLLELQTRIDQPTLGKWKGMCLAVAKHLPADQSRVLELPETLTKSLIPFLDGAERKRTPETSFATLRNQLAHGGGVTKVVASRLLDIWKDKFEEVVVSFSWVRNISLVVKTEANAFGVLCGPNREPAPYTPQGDAEQEALDSVFVRGDEVAFVRRQVVVPLWPMSIYGLPSLSDPEAPVATSPIPQIYVRRGEVFPQFTPIGSDELCQSEGDQDTLTAFFNFFRFHELEAEMQQSGFTVRGFERDLRKDADRLVGRSLELERIRNAVEQTSAGVLWLTGPAGIGKSYVVARIAAELSEGEEAGNRCVLPFRFKAGDDRCSSEQFLRFAIERLEAWEPLDCEAQGNKEKPIDRFKDLLGRLPKGKLIIIILDGLDELAETASAFAQKIPLTLSFEGVLWLCAGRPERGLPEAFTPERCQHVFSGGLSPMSTGDVRTMLIEKIGPLRKRLVRNDREQDSVVVNPFIDRVSEYAAGLPIYVTYVIGDILSNRFRALDAGERLPPSLVHYHEELLRRCSVGILQQLLTPLAASVAVSLEPMTAQALTQLMIHGNVLPDDERASGLVAKGLSALGAMLRRATNPDGKEGFSLFHHSLRQHMQRSPSTQGVLSTAQTTFCRHAMLSNFDDTDLSRYTSRWGNVHLMQCGDIEAVFGHLRDREHVQHRTASVGGDYVINDLKELWGLGTFERFSVFDIAIGRGSVIESVIGYDLWAHLPPPASAEDFAQAVKEERLGIEELVDCFSSILFSWNDHWVNWSQLEVLDKLLKAMTEVICDLAGDLQRKELQEFLRQEERNVSGDLMDYEREYYRDLSRQRVRELQDIISRRMRGQDKRRLP
jgi:hypothetical protein